MLFRLGAGLSVLYFLFYALWGLNYSRMPVAQNLGLDIEQYDIEKIENLTERIINRTSSLHQNLSDDDTLPVVSPYTKAQYSSTIWEGYGNYCIGKAKDDASKSSATVTKKVTV